MRYIPKDINNTTLTMPQSISLQTSKSCFIKPVRIIPPMINLATSKQKLLIFFAKYTFDACF